MTLFRTGDVVAFAGGPRTLRLFGDLVIVNQMTVRERDEDNPVGSGLVSTVSEPYRFTFPADDLVFIRSEEDEEEYRGQTFRHIWVIQRGGQVRECERCGQRETYWDDDEYPFDECPLFHDQQDCALCAINVGISHAYERREA